MITVNAAENLADQSALGHSKKHATPAQKSQLKRGLQPEAGFVEGYPEGSFPLQEAQMPLWGSYVLQEQQKKPKDDLSADARSGLGTSVHSGRPAPENIQETAPGCWSPPGRHLLLAFQE